MNMVAIPNLTQNMFYITLAAIVVVGLISLIIQWRRVSVSKTNINFLSKQAELRKMELVERDMESNWMMKDIDLHTNKKGKEVFIEENTSGMMKKAVSLNNEINNRVNNFELTTEYLKIQKLIKDIDEKEVDVDHEAEKFKGKNIL
jgi:hypothetical protein